MGTPCARSGVSLLRSQAYLGPLTSAPERRSRRCVRSTGFSRACSTNGRRLPWRTWEPRSNRRVMRPRLGHLRMRQGIAGASGLRRGPAARVGGWVRGPGRTGTADADHRARWGPPKRTVGPSKAPSKARRPESKTRAGRPGSASSQPSWSCRGTWRTLPEIAKADQGLPKKTPSLVTQPAPASS